jgi:4-amino-4-deoxy-L-arabinose transferase-like glycosyltransferase
MNSASYRRALPWLGLALVLVFYVVSILRSHPTNFFGLTQDDTIYFSSAQALAAGKGYILPSIPGTPAATKYPILYPWILSWVWRWNPSFPSNLADAVAVSVVFGCVFLTLAFVFLRTMKGISDAEALFLTAFCALHPLVIFYGGSVLSDIPFAALAFAAMLVADLAMRRDANSAWSVGSAILVGLSMLTRVFGVPVAAGIVVAGLTRRSWRQVFVFCGCVAPFFATVAWRAICPHLPEAPVTGAAASSLGWTRTWVYYTSYLGAWKLGVPNGRAFWAMLGTNAGFILRGPSDIFLSPLLMPDNPYGRALVAIVAVASVAGIIRQARAQEWKPIAFVLPFYLTVILFWNFPDSNNRYFLPCWPLFAAGLWLEARHVLAMVRTTILSPRRPWNKMVGLAFGVAIVALGVGIAWNYMYGMRPLLMEKSGERAAFLEGKRGAYEWLSHNTANNTHLIAYEDVSLYLYTGRAVMSPMAAVITELYEPARLGESLAHMTDLPRAIGAEFWVFSDDDFVNSREDISARAGARMSELERVLPIVYQSEDGRVRIHALGCIQHPEALSCQAADRVLFSADK